VSPLAHVTDEQVGDVAIVAIEGEVDASNAVAVGDRVRGALTNRSTALIVDLSHTRYIDSAGINQLFALDLELSQRRQALHVVVPATSPLARLLAIAGLDLTVAMHATRAAALERTAAA
jgi:anti-anti-sigma factor